MMKSPAAPVRIIGFWNKKLGILGALGSCGSFVGTITIIPFFPNGWAASAGGFPAMTGDVAFLMKDVVLLAVSVYLLKQDVLRVVSAVRRANSQGHRQSHRPGLELTLFQTLIA